MLVCSEYGFGHNWAQQGDSYLLEVQCEHTHLSFHFERALLDDPGSDDYRIVAEKLLERLLSEFKAHRTVTH